MDGYNVIFAWEELKELARGKSGQQPEVQLLDLLCNYQAIDGRWKLIAVFDAYRVAGTPDGVPRIIITFMWYLQKKQRQQINILKNLHI